MARKQYDLSRGSELFGKTLRQFGAKSLGGGRFHAFGGFASGGDIASFIASEGYNISAGRYQATHTVEGRREFVGTDVANAVMQLLQDDTPFDEWKHIPKKGGKIFQFEFPVGFFGELSKWRRAERRFGIFMRTRTAISNVASSYFRRYMQQQIPQIKAVIAAVIQDRVYDQDVELIRYKKRGKPSDFRDNSKSKRSYNLLKAFTEGVVVSPTGVSFGVNESLAPYWLWVEKGHRVILPMENAQGETIMVETGTFVKGRPFVNEIDVAVQEYLNYMMEDFAENVAARIPSAIAHWIVEDGDSREVEGMTKAVKYYPKMGYGAEFDKYVGIA